ncbi:dynein light chain, putative [Hepatocystis sp. ex Piliocolobus tephrosceles]|nr:dynein light chain, putative [Hepatocystis sp. ex Piliocolobus tephrosceles]
MKITDSLKALVNNDLKNNFVNCDNKEEISNNISSIIKNHLKSLTSNKYKIIVEILLNENKRQGINVSTKLFYNKQSDFFFKECIDYFHLIQKKKHKLQDICNDE